jgi:hypothetical protein
VPEHVADHEHASLVFGQGQPSERGLRAQRRKQGVGDAGHADPLHPLVGPQRAGEGAVERDVREQARGFLVLEEELLRDPELPFLLGARRLGGDEDQPIRVSVGERVEHDPVQDGEHAGDDADGEPQRADYRGREAGRPPERAQGMAQLGAPAIQGEAHRFPSKLMPTPPFKRADSVYDG